MSQPNPDFWKRKLAAFLHDPPHKPYRIARHEDARASFWNEAHLDPEEFKAFFDRFNDHWAAAADRMIFPDPGRSGVRTDWKADADCAFHHPLCGSKLLPDQFPATPADAEEKLHTALQGAGIKAEDDDGTKFWKLWRLWPEIAAREHGHFAYLVADTRVPHHSIWHHNGLVSALSSSDKNPAFLLFQIGPVQDFIKQARSTRDLWAGSYLLSYLIASAMFAVAKVIGPESIVYPQLRGVPLIDWFGHGADAQFWSDEMRASYRDEHGTRAELLTPNLPNRFLALVSKDWRNERDETIAQIAEAAVRKAWQEIATSVHNAIDQKLRSAHPDWDQFWEKQTNRFPTVDYIIHDWQDTETVLQQAAAGTPPLHGGWEKHPLKQAIIWATERILPEHFDARCYKHGSWQEGISCMSQLLDKHGNALREGETPLIENRGFVWALHYAATEWRFAAAKNARQTPAWGTTLGVEKDHLDGRNEVLGGRGHDAFWKDLRTVDSWGEGSPKELFKGSQEYGALTTVKRLFPYVWLKDALDTAAPRFDSVWEIAQENGDDASIYYAALCMDGDDMGKWVSGTKTPLWKDVLSGNAEEPTTPLGYFARHWGAGWETVQAPLTPSFHAALSEAIGNFSLYCARQIVEAFDGRLIYAGGDDVLAMLPAGQALDCAQALQLVFRGVDPAAPDSHASQQVKDKLATLFHFPAPGFIQCLQGTGKGEHQRPNWPMVVMGPASTASIGIAIGHIRSPMQDVIQAAREAEHVAKAVPNKGALALRVLKRSGESVEFAARFDSTVLGVWAELDHHGDSLRGRFIYRFLQKLRPVLASVVEGRAAWEPKWEKGQINLREIATAELADTLYQQTDLYRHAKDGRRAKCRELAANWMRRLESLDPTNFLHFWMARAFLNRLDKSGKETTDS